MIAAQEEVFARAAMALERWRSRPDSFVREEFLVDPDPWQLDVLQAFPENQRIAMTACKGPGKSATLSWLVWNFLATRPFPKVAVTSVTGDNLRDGLWAELGKWYKRSPFLRQMFEYRQERIVYRDDPDNWFCAARRWRKDSTAEQQADTLAGLHADALLFVVDEAGSIPDAVVAAAEGGLATGGDTKLVLAGNPTVCEGPLFRAATSEAELWALFEVTGDPDDPRRAPRVDIEWARAQIRKYGRSSPWVQVNVFGRFPSGGTEALLGIQEVLDAIGRETDTLGDPLSREGKAIGLDVARKGTNLSVLTLREGDLVVGIEFWQGQDTVYTAGRAKEAWERFSGGSRDCRIFVDDTGIGGGVSDVLDAQGLPFVPVNACEPADDPEHHTDRRSEIALALQDRFRTGRISIDPKVREDSTLVQDATQLRITFDLRGRRRLEPKDSFKKRTGRSPDFWDSLALAFYEDAASIGAGASSEDLVVATRSALASNVLEDRLRQVRADAEDEEAGELLPRRRQRMRIGRWAS